MASRLEISSHDSDNDTETIRIKNGIISLQIRVFKGMQGDFFMYYAPSVNVSGYGDTDVEALDSFKYNLDVFTDDLLKQKSDIRSSELSKLGWKRSKIHSKNFSKAYIDKEGVLQNFDPDHEVESILMELD